MTRAKLDYRPGKVIETGKERKGYMWENTTQEENAVRVCSFCRKRQDQVLRLTRGPGNVNICDECVDLYREHLDKEAGKAINREKWVQFVAPAASTLLQVTATAIIVKADALTRQF